MLPPIRVRVRFVRGANTLSPLLRTVGRRITLHSTELFSAVEILLTVCVDRSCRAVTFSERKILCPELV